MFKKILVPTDGSPLSEKAIQAAVKFATEVSAKLVAISVADPHVPIAPIVGGIPLDTDFYDGRYL
jgi:nucleotide-binding universal stress UspA family protein